MEIDIYGKTYAILISKTNVNTSTDFFRKTITVKTPDRIRDIEFYLRDELTAAICEACSMECKMRSGELRMWLIKNANNVKSLIEEVRVEITKIKFGEMKRCSND